MTIRRNFSRAANTYDRFADVQAEVAGRLAAMLPSSGNKIQIIELGCGTGKLTAQLREKYPSARITAVDFVHEMLRKASEWLSTDQVELICQDLEEFMAAARKEVDLIVSNATFQWIKDLDAVLADIRRSLKKEGLLLFSIFGPETLFELQQAFDAVLPGKVRIAAAAFKDRETIDRLAGRYFPRIEVEEMTIRREFPSFVALLGQIKKTGTSGDHPRPVRLGRNSLRALDRWFLEHYGNCRASYQVLFYRCER
jgi:malonyl-CoA O-methyltransferase